MQDMDAIALMKRIVALERQGLAAVDAPMLHLLCELQSHLPVILTTLEQADDARASLENVLCHLGDRMTAVDQLARSRVAADLLQSLQVLSGHPGEQLH